MQSHSGYDKKEGFIIQIKNPKALQSQQRSLSHDLAMTNHSTMYSQYEKSPGEIRRPRRSGNSGVEKIDEEVYYNADVYFKYEKVKRPIVQYEESQDIAIQVRSTPKKQQSPSKLSQSHMQQRGSESKNEVSLHNVHGGFKLDRYQELYHFLKNIQTSMQISEIQLLKSIKSYLHFITKEGMTNVSEFKFIPNKRQILKQSFAIERESVIVICLAIATNRLESLKNYCSNLVKYAFENFLITLNLLTQQKNEYVASLLVGNSKEHLIGKGFDVVRSNNQIMTSLISRIARSDPLFSGEFCKIVENYSSHSVEAEFYSILTFFAFYLHASKATDRVPFLSASPGPFLISKPSSEYTLIIDFVRIFIDASVPLRKQIKKDHFLIRPYAQYFLSQLSKYFQIISWSDYMPIECNKIINKIDERKCVRHRLYRYHIDSESRKKEVEKVGRSGDRTVLIDASQSLRNDNLLLINSWKGEVNDAILAEICPLLAMIPVKKLSALESLRKIRQASSRNASLGLKYINCGLDL